jgi:hypothetical protein
MFPCSLGDPPPAFCLQHPEDLTAALFLPVISIAIPYGLKLHSCRYKFQEGLSWHCPSINMVVKANKYELDSGSICVGNRGMVQ